MDISKKTAANCIDALLKASQKFEEQLTTEGIPQAHEWMFAVREVLYDLRRLNLLLADMYNQSDVNQSLTLLKGIVQTILYEIIPHVEGHMSELEEGLSTMFSEANSESDDEITN